MPELARGKALLEPHEKEGKLPKWAKNYIGSLRTALASAIAHAEGARLATKPDDTDTLIDYYSDVPIGLPPGERVRFLVGDELLGKHRDWIDVRVTGSVVDVMASRGLAILPGASNTCRMGVSRL